MKRVLLPAGIAMLAAAVAGCTLIRKDLESQVLASLRERSLASGSGISVDSVRLGAGDGSAYPGIVHLRLGEVRERDSIRVKAGIAALEYDFPSPGSLVSRIFRAP
jgi:hypothetical protein